MNKTLNSFAELAEHLSQDLWNKPPGQATIKECRAFAKKHDLRLPSGLPQTKEAFVVMFMVCRFATEGLVKYKDTSLTQGDLNKLFGYHDELDKKRHSKSDTSDKRPVAVASKKEPSTQTWPRRFSSVEEWHAHNAAVEKRLNKKQSNAAVKKSSAQTWPAKFASVEEWQAHNVAAVKKPTKGNFKRKHKITTKATGKPPKGFTPRGQQVHAPQLGR